MKLHKYERDAVRELRRLLKEEQRVVAVGPTGCGKTVIGSAIVRPLKAQRTLWLAHRIELLRQARKEIIKSGVPKGHVGILSGPDKGNLAARVLVASVDMFRTQPVPDVELIVVDEAHRIEAKSYQKIIRARPNAGVLGLTATPWRLDGKGLGDTFRDMYLIAGPTELITGGYLASPIVYGIPREKARAMVAGVKSIRGDYAQGQLAVAMMKRTLMGDVVSECARLAPGERTIVFAVNREHGRALAKRFKRAGRRVEYLDGDTPNGVRDAMLERFRTGETEVIVNVDVLSEGFDLPAVKCIVLARPTRSLTRFLQQIGRASRPYKGKRPIILDHAGNCWRFGMPQGEREWTLDGRAKGGGDGDNPFVKECPECEATIAASCHVCPECGAEQPVPERKLREQQAELERLRATEAERAAARRRLEQIAKTRGAPANWVQSVLDRMFSGDIRAA